MSHWSIHQIGLVALYSPSDFSRRWPLFPYYPICGKPMGFWPPRKIWSCQIQSRIHGSSYTCVTLSTGHPSYKARFPRTTITQLYLRSREFTPLVRIRFSIPQRWPYKSSTTVSHWSIHQKGLVVLYSPSDFSRMWPLFPYYPICGTPMGFWLPRKIWPCQIQSRIHGSPCIYVATIKRSNPSYKASRFHRTILTQLYLICLSLQKGLGFPLPKGGLIRGDHCIKLVNTPNKIGCIAFSTWQC